MSQVTSFELMSDVQSDALPTEQSPQCGNERLDTRVAYTNFVPPLNLKYI